MISVLRWGWVVSTTPRSSYLRGRPCTHCTGGWVGPRAGLDECEKSRPLPGFDPRTVQPVASRYTDYTIPARSWGGDKPLIRDSKPGLSNRSLIIIMTMLSVMPFFSSPRGYYAVSTGKYLPTLVTILVVSSSISSRPVILMRLCVSHLPTANFIKCDYSL